MKTYGQRHSAWRSRCGQELREREDRREGGFREVAKGFQGTEEGGPSLRQRLAEMAKMHSSKAFYALDDPLEAAVFSVLVEMMKEQYKKIRRNITLRTLLYTIRPSSTPATMDAKLSSLFICFGCISKMAKEKIGQMAEIII
jgi:hypothetical protein